MLQAATTHWQRHEYGRYFAAMEAARRMDPGNHAILIDVAAKHGARCEYEAAEEFFERAVSLAPNKSEALAIAGLHCRNFNRYEMAERYFERAAHEKNATPDTLAKLAEMCERLRRTADATAAVDRALAIDPDNALALLVHARLERMAGRVEEGERILRTLLARTDGDSWSTRVRGWYELGANLDRQSRYDEAMAAFVQAKSLIANNARPYAATQRGIHRKLRDAVTEITADVLREWHHRSIEMAAGEPPRRFAVLGGHPRSGTTLLEQVLDSHPQVVSAEETALFFETYVWLRRELPNELGMKSVLDQATSAQLRAARRDYLAHMDRFVGSPTADRLLIDKNPSLTTLVPAILRVVPEAKFLIALRDPRDVCLSCFMQPLPLNPTSSMFLTVESTAEEYASTMGFWRAMSQRLPNPAAAIEVRYEDLVDDLASASKRVLEFLNLPWDDRVMRFNEYARQKLVRSPTYADVARPISKGAVGRWRHYQKYMEPALAALEPFVKAFGYE
jgi:tetratricopeptide (TPR) repeat protein